MNHAGLLDDQDKLTKKSRDKFIDDVVNEMRFGSPSLPIVNFCGDELKPIPYAELTDLYDTQMYAAWHAMWPPQLEKMAQNMNVKGGMPFFPIIFDMSALFALMVPNVEIPPFPFPPELPPDFPKIALELFKLDPSIPVPEWVIKLGSFKPPIPDIPKIPPEIPKLDYDLLPNWSFSIFAQYMLPKLAIDLFTLEFAMKIPDLPNLMKAICKLVKKTCFPPTEPSAQGVDVANIAAQAVLARRFVEMTTIVLAACTVGSSPVGIVGTMGAKFGYRPPPGGNQEESAAKLGSIQQDIIDAAASGVGLHSSRSLAHSSILKAYAEFLFPDIEDASKRDGWVSDVNFSSCACYMRTVYRKARGGNVGNKNVDAPFSSRPFGSVISDLMNMAKVRGAFKLDTYSMTSDLMSLDIKPGDGVIIGEDFNIDPKNPGTKINDLKTHVLIVAEELGTAASSKNLPAKNRSFVTYEGGAPNVMAVPGQTVGSQKDANNVTLMGGQRITKSSYTFTQQNFGGVNQKIKISTGFSTGKVILYIFDGEKMLTPNGDG